MSEPSSASAAETRGTCASRPMERATWAWLAALVGWTTVISFYGIGGGAGFELTDCWVAQTAREMLEAGDWFMPRFSGEVRLQKSPGAYWAVMLVSLLRGQPVDEISTRIPNALSAIVLVVTIFWLTRRIAGDRAAIFAGFASASSMLILWWSHRGSSDLGVAACTTVSLATLWVAAECEPPGAKRIGLLLVGYFAAGLGMLYKLPMPLVVVGLPAFLYLLLFNRWRVLASGWHLLGLLLFLLPWLTWAIAVVSIEPAALARWKVEFWDRFTGALPNVHGQRAWYFHFVYLVPPVIFCMPYTLSLPGAIGRAFRRHPDRDRVGMLFMLVWFFGLLAFFTVAAGKETRYFLPALPPLFVLLGVELARFFDPRREANPRSDRLGALAVWILVPLGMIAGGFGVYEWYEALGVVEGFAWSEVWPPYAVAAGLFSAGCGVSAWLFVRRRENASFAALVVTMWLVWMWAWPRVMPVFVSQRSFIDLAAQLRQKIEPEWFDRMYHIGNQDSRIVWHSDIRIPRLIDQLEILEIQDGTRSLEREREFYGERIIEKLAGDEPVLFMGFRLHYIDLLIEAPPTLEEQGREMPLTHLWLQSRLAPKARAFVVFGNRPPPWPEPALSPPSDRLKEAQAGREARPPASRPTSRGS